jgi:hypothetical protein
MLRAEIMTERVAVRQAPANGACESPPAVVAIQHLCSVLNLADDEKGRWIKAMCGAAPAWAPRTIHEAGAPCKALRIADGQLCWSTGGRHTHCLPASRKKN